MKVDDGNGMIAQQRMSEDGNPLFAGITAGKLRRRRDLCSQACVCSRRRRDVEGGEVESRPKRWDACETECVCVCNNCGCNTCGK